VTGSAKDAQVTFVCRRLTLLERLSGLNAAAFILIMAVGADLSLTATS
jgi:hypothetical protein